LKIVIIHTDSIFTFKASQREARAYFSCINLLLLVQVAKNDGLSMAYDLTKLKIISANIHILI